MEGYYTEKAAQVLFGLRFNGEEVTEEFCRQIEIDARSSVYNMPGDEFVERNDGGYLVCMDVDAITDAVMAKAIGWIRRYPLEVGERKIISTMNGVVQNFDVAVTWIFFGVAIASFVLGFTVKGIIIKHQMNKGKDSKKS